ncbi:unnamed protein product [Peronospora farinosa]|uniref:Vesicle transport v-SNARE N-terminal domain-containing protein n=1 Tax=Peronospora farinosa TaxID=134698 RepID=A0AAV0UVU2_9STRA|nr:unnamed protein product [Peronospora farinosa]CAH0491743.1 unnamed protein product [Peronospora farinosa]CAI5741067.1 unnamed protein product [Peronospora farinosa]
MTVFDGYYDDYQHAQQEALEAIDEYKHTLNSVDREQLAVTAKNNVDEVERYIRILENEAKTLSSLTEKRKMMETVYHCKTKWMGLKASLEKEMLVGDVRGNNLPISSSDATTTEQLESCAERIDRTGRHLDDAQRTLAQTEAIAENVSNNLLQQRNQLEHTELNIAQTQDETEEAKGYIRSMAFKACTSRILLFLVMLALVAAIVLVSYFKWYPRNQTDHLGILPNSNTTNSTTGAASQ